MSIKTAVSHMAPEISHWFVIPVQSWKSYCHMLKTLPFPQEWFNNRGFWLCKLSLYYDLISDLR